MMPEQISTAQRRRPLVHRRTFTGENGETSVQWGIYDIHRTWHGYPDQAAAVAAAFGEFLAA